MSDIESGNSPSTDDCESTLEMTSKHNGDSPHFDENNFKRNCVIDDVEKEHKAVFEEDGVVSYVKTSQRGRLSIKLIVTMLVLFSIFVIADIAQFYFIPTTFKIKKTEIMINAPLKTSLVVEITSASSIFPLGAKATSCDFNYIKTVPDNSITAAANLRLPLGKVKISDMNMPSSLHMFAPRTTSHAIDLTMHDFSWSNAQSLVQVEVLPSSK